MRRPVAIIASASVICLLVFLAGPGSRRLPEHGIELPTMKAPSHVERDTSATSPRGAADARQLGCEPATPHLEEIAMVPLVSDWAGRSGQTISETLDMGENLFWTREQRAESLRHDPAGIKLLGDAIKRPFGKGEGSREDWYGQRLEGLHLLEILGRSRNGQGPPGEVGDLLETLIVGRRDHGHGQESVRLAVSLRREAMSSLARVDPYRAIELYRQLPDKRQRQFFAHFLLIGLADETDSPGTAAALVRDIDDALAAGRAPDVE